MGLDIFTFTLEDCMRPDPVTYAKIKVVDAESLKGVQAKIELVNLFNTSQKRSETANEKGEALLCFPMGAKYAFTVSEKGYLFYSESFELENNRSIAKPYKIEIELQPVKVGSEMNLYNIYFETDSFRILSESEPELQKLISFLEINSELEIEIQGHTDNTGSNSKNKQLSQLRANSVAQYLNNAGISSNRLIASGLGEQKPVASNDTPKGRELNRRTTIKITAK